MFLGATAFALYFLRTTAEAVGGDDAPELFYVLAKSTELNYGHLFSTGQLMDPEDLNDALHKAIETDIPDEV